MTPLILASAALLLLPWLLGPVAGRAGERPEVRGFLKVLWWLNRGYCAAFHRLVILGDAPLPEHGPAILIANHTSGIDHCVLQAGCLRTLGFVIAVEFHEFWAIRPLTTLLNCIPVRRDGRDLGATREALRALERGRVLPIFPEGRITPKSGLEFGPGKPGAAFLTLKAGVPVIPAYIRGTPRVGSVGRAIITPSRARVLFGPPIDFSDLDVPADDHEGERARLARVTERLMDSIKALQAPSLALEATL